MPNNNGKRTSRHFTSAAQRFMSNVTVGINDECWPWKGKRDSKGYGRMLTPDSPSKTTGAHRWSYITFNGPVDDDTVIRHTCDNPPCVNPAHLLAGTQADNMQDAADRLRTRAGIRHPKAKFTAQEIEDMRILWQESGLTQKQIGAIFGIHQGSVSRIVRHRRWKRMQ